MRKNRLLSLLLTATMLAAAAMFAACSGDKDGTSEKEPDTPDSGEGIKLGEPIGLVYTDFLTETDVIHNADTTELRISKALADKKGITDFVNRPMGIWDQKEHRAYLRRATEQRLEGDRYVLKVVRSSVAEVTHGQEMALNTGIYYNPTRMASRRGLTRASGGNAEADKYIDDDNVIHPAAITVQMKSDAPAEARALTRASGDGNSATFTIEELYTNPPSGANGWFDWLEDLWDEIVEATSYDWDDDKTISLIHTSTTLKKNITIDCGDDAEDIIKLDFKCPIQFDLDYTLNIRSHGSVETAFLPIPSYLATYIEGYFEANPQLLLGFSKTISLPEDKERITLFQFSGIGFTFMIGPVPLTIDIDPSVYLKFTADLMGNASLGVQYDIATKFKAGVKYDNGWSGIGEGEKVKDEFSFINPKASLKFTGSAGIYFGVDVIIEKVAGPSFNIGPQVGVEAELSYQVGDDHVKASIEGTAGIGGEAGAKIKIFGFEVAEWHSYFDIGPQWTICKYPDDGSGSSGDYDPDKGGGGVYDPTGSNAVDLSQLTTDYVVRNGQTITGTLKNRVKVSIADGATVKLTDATIDGYDDQLGDEYLWAGITCEGDATIILQGTNRVRGFYKYWPGIFVPQGKTLTIQGTGSLTASSNGLAAGIGGGHNINCGNIVIEGGTINATGGHRSAGIGGSGLGTCGNITITSDVKSVTATKGSEATYSIGAGFHWDSWACGTVTIGGKVTGQIIQSPFTYTPAPVTGVSLSQTEAELKPGETLTLTANVAPDNAWNKNVIWSSSNNVVAIVNENGVVTAKTAGTTTITATTIDGGKKATCAVTVITPVTGVTLSKTSAMLEAGETLRLKATVTPANATVKSVTWTSSNPAVATVAGSVATVTEGVVTAKAAGTTTITANVDGQKTATCAVTVYDDSDEYIVDLGTLTGDYTAYDGDILTGTLGKNVKISIASGATVTLRNATINGVDNEAYQWAGINPRGDATIVLEGTNSVRGFHNDYPGIHIPQGKTLTIKGSGSLNASSNGSFGGAGIGGAWKLNCGNIRIEGGTINAVGRHRSPGIGGGSNASCGTITITDGVTSVTATKGGYAPYSIGPGDSGTCGTITIGGQVTGPIGESPYTYKP